MRRGGAGEAIARNERRQFVKLGTVEAGVRPIYGAVEDGNANPIVPAARAPGSLATIDVDTLAPALRKHVKNTADALRLQSADGCLGKKTARDAGTQGL